MYINSKPAAEYAANVNERVFGSNSEKNSLSSLSCRTSYTPFNKKSWAEVIRLYKESKKEKTLMS